MAPLLSDFLAGVSRTVPDPVGAWVYGSVALGGFDRRSSDIDLIVATNGPLSNDQIDQLASLHEGLDCRHPLGSRLEVQYLTLPVLKGGAPVVDSPVYRDGSFVRAGRGDLNATTRWVLREHGITLSGLPAAELPLDVNWDDVRAAMRFNLTEYWPAYATSRAMDSLQEDTPVVWPVATLCRILSTVIDGVILTKPAAVQVWVERVPERWSVLLDEVRRVQGHGGSMIGYVTPFDRARDVREFVTWACMSGLAALDCPSRSNRR